MPAFSDPLPQSICRCINQRLFPRISRWISCTALTLAIAGAATLGANESANAAGLLTPTGSSQSLQIARHQVDVTIEDGYAITQVDQTFHNPHAQDLTALYSFPVPEQAAVSGFSVWIDGKPVIGEVFAKEKAKQLYEEEKKSGRDTGLVEKNGYKTFEIQVSPVRANNDARIRLTYMQTAVTDMSVGRFVYPLEDGGVDEEQARFWQTNDMVTTQFGFAMTIKSAVPVDAVRLPGYQATIDQQAPGQWTVRLENNRAAPGGSQAGDNAPALAEALEAGLVHSNTLAASSVNGASAHKLNKDLVVYWRLAPDLPASVDMVTYKPDANGRGTFMMVLTPGDELKAINRGKDWTFVVDVSGSMSGKYATVLNGMRQTLAKLKPDDQLRIVLFNNKAIELTNGYEAASPGNVSRLLDKLQNTGPQGGTNLYEGLSTALASLNADRTSSVVLITDGVANVGTTVKSAFLKLVNARDVRLFTMIMGNSANRPLLNDMTDASGGFAISLSNSDDVVGQLHKALAKVSHQAMHDVKVSMSGVRTADLVRSRDSSLYFGDQLVVFGHYWGDGTSQLKLNAKISGTPRQWTTQFAMPVTATSNPEVERLWAYSMVESLQRQMDLRGEMSDLKNALVDIATGHSIVTDHTSMVVMSEQAFTERGIDRRNQARTQVERQATQQRAQRAAVTRRVDRQQPAFKGNRQRFGNGGSGTGAGGGGGGGGGGGSVNGAWLLLLLAALGWLACRRPRRHQCKV